MKTRFAGSAALAFATMIAASAPLLAQQEANLTGTWKFAIHGDHTIPAGMELKQEGAKVTGTLMLMGKDIALDGELANGVVTLNSNARLAAPGAPADPDAPKLKIVGKLEEDGTLSGKLPGPHGGEMEWTAERFKERKARPSAEKQVTDAGSGVTGTWDVAAKGDHVAHVAMVLKQDGTKVTGTLMMQGNDVPLEGEFAGGKLAVSGTAPEGTGHGAGMTMKLTATLAADGTLAGEFATPGRAMQWTAERLKKTKE